MLPLIPGASLIPKREIFCRWSRHTLSPQVVEPVRSCNWSPLQAHAETGVLHARARGWGGTGSMSFRSLTCAICSFTCRRAGHDGEFILSKVWQVVYKLLSSASPDLNNCIISSYHCQHQTVNPDDSLSNLHRCTHHSSSNSSALSRQRSVVGHIASASLKFFVSACSRHWWWRHWSCQCMDLTRSWLPCYYCLQRVGISHQEATPYFTNCWRSLGISSCCLWPTYRCHLSLALETMELGRL